MGQSVGTVSSTASSSQGEEEECVDMLSLIPLPVLEEVFFNLSPVEVVCACRLVCREWKDVADAAALWRERCRRDGYRPGNVARPPSDWRHFYFLCKKRRNLVQDTYAEEGPAGREISEGRSGKWRLVPPADFHLIDLVKEGYSQSFMDAIQPDIVISDWYTPGWDYKSMYEIRVELMNQKKEVVFEFSAGPGHFQSIARKWQQVTHVLRDYGQGVCFIRLFHGARHMRLQTMLYEIHVTGGRVEICPSTPA